MPTGKFRIDIFKKPGIFGNIPKSIVKTITIKIGIDPHPFGNFRSNRFVKIPICPLIKKYTYTIDLMCSNDFLMRFSSLAELYHYINFSVPLAIHLSNDTVNNFIVADCLSNIRWAHSDGYFEPPRILKRISGRKTHSLQECLH